MRDGSDPAARSRGSFSLRGADLVSPTDDLSSCEPPAHTTSAELGLQHSPAEAGPHRSPHPFPEGVTRTGQQPPPDGPRLSITIRPNAPPRRRTPRGERGGWASRSGFRLVGRDLDLLYTVGRFRLATTSQLRLLFFGSSHTARDRLAKLREAGLLRCLVRGLAEESLYVLTARGRTLLVEDREIEPEDVALARSVPAHALHFIRTNDVRAALVSRLRDRTDLVLGSFTPAWALGDEAMRRHVELVPDALVTIETPRGDVRVAVEVDLGTEPPNYVARRKLATYDRLIASGVGVFGVVPDRVVFLAPGVRRLRHLAAAIHEAGVGRCALLGDLDEPTTRTLVAPTFAMAGEITGKTGDELRAELRRPLHPSLASPHGPPLPQGDKEPCSPPESLSSAMGTGTEYTRQASA